MTAKSPESPLDKARAAVRRLPRLSAVPEATLRAGRLAQDPDSSQEELAEAFGADAAMCAHLLKVANSSYYGVQSEVKSVERAATLLGRRVLANVAIAASMRAIVRKLDKGGGAVSQFWVHSLRSAGAAAALAVETRACDPSEAHVAALIHDLGVLVGLEVDPIAYEDRLVEGEYKLEDELADYGTTHLEYGVALCELWGLPDSLRDVMQYHHDPLELEGPSRTLVALVRAADRIANTHGEECEIDDSVVACLEVLGVEATEVEALVEVLRSAASESTFD